MERSWQRIESVVGAVDPDGLRPPAPPEDLVALGVPASWRGLWERHDGQSPSVGGVLLGFTFLPLRGTADSVEAEIETVPDGFLPFAKDFAGGLFAVDVASGAVHRLDTDGVELLAPDLLSFLHQVAEHLEADPPRRWVWDGDRYVPGGRRVVSIPEVSEWAVGEPRDLCEGLVLVRVRSPDAAPFVQHGSRMDLVLDHPSQSAACGELVSVRVTLPTGPEGTVGGASVTVHRQGERTWLEAQGPIPRAATLEVEVDVEGRLKGPRPLFHGGAPTASGARASGRAALGDLSGALEDALAADDDPALLADLALATGDLALAERAVGGLAHGHPLRVRALAAIDPLRALAEVDHWVEARPDPVAHAWRATLLEGLGRFAESVVDTEQALALLDEAHAQEGTSLRSALRRRRARVAAPRMDAPVLEDPTEEVVLDAVPVERDGSGWKARVLLAPEEAENGRLVELRFPSGDRGAVRLPRGAGHGVSATLLVGPSPESVHVELYVELPRGWRSEGDNPTLSFDRWDVIAPVPSPNGRVRVSGLDRLHELSWPSGAAELTIPGGGLARADGSRGDLRVLAR